MRTWGAAVVVALGLASVAASSKSTAPPVAIRVGPTVAFAPASVRIVTFVEPNCANRSLTVEVDSGEHFSSSESPLNGDRSARTHTTELKDLPAGTYQVHVVVEHEDGSEVTATDVFSVVGR